MTFQILVEPNDGQFSARLLGDDTICVVRPTRHEAVDAVTHELKQKIARGEIVSVEIPVYGGAAAIAGMGKDDPTMRELVAEIYAERNRERDALPE